MLRAPVIYLPGTGGRSHERTIMGNLAVAEELAGSEELDELYKLDMSDTESDDDEDGEDEDEDGKFEDEEIPQG